LWVPTPAPILLTRIPLILVIFPCFIHDSPERPGFYPLFHP
jgi:hypothetical protein